MKVLVLGSGGREHALAWRLSRDTSVQQVCLHPGNAGTWQAGIPTLGDVPFTVDAISAAARRQGIELIVVGPEVLLAQGYADRLRADGFNVVGPGKIGAQLETSKAFAKRFLQAANIPTADYYDVDSAEGVRKAVGETYPIVLKLDGLAAGKGVVVAQSASDTEDFIRRVWQTGEFGAGPHRVVVETFLEGRELSYIGLCDGETFVALSSASDYKRLQDDDRGPNTGGMGAISPSPLASPELEKRIQEKVVGPTLAQLRHQGIEYRGALYFGLMISSRGEPFVLEFNTRFGDPETQALMLRLQGDFAELLSATAQGRLAPAAPPKFSNDCAVYVVAAAAGYPGTPRSGDAIEGLDSISADATVFFSGVAKANSGLTTQGGRVLGIGAVGRNAEECRDRVYDALKIIRWPGVQFRQDIGVTFT